MGEQGQWVATFHTCAGEALFSADVGRRSASKNRRRCSAMAASVAICVSTQRVWRVAGDEVGVGQDVAQEADIGGHAFQSEFAQCPVSAADA